jgi:MinD-like ATPase involved in chromosome partitioning or flagellar assembly
LVVTTPHISAIRDADKVITLLKSYALQHVQLVVNKLRGEQLAIGQGLSAKQIADLLKTPCIGVLPKEKEIGESEFSFLHPSFKLLARNLLNKEKTKLYDVTKKYVGPVGALRRFIKRSI